MTRIDTQQPPAQRGYAIAVVCGAIIVVIGLLSLENRASAWATGGVSLIVLAPVTFLAGMLSFLSPCCLPVLSAYVAYTAQVQRERLTITTLAFFGGVATTMVALGASATALSQVLFRYLPALTTIGGLLIIGFGVMSLLGRGFSVALGKHTLYLHTTSIASGLLLIIIGLLLATGQLSVFSQWAVQTPLTQ